MVRAKLLAETIPAVSYAAGANAVQGFVDPEGTPRNFDMATAFRELEGNVAVWPEERGTNKDWRHGDMHRIALPYLYDLYARMKELGDL